MDVLSSYVLQRAPRVLGLIDKNPYSATYGCFDRSYWHYKKADFPSGMYQVGSLTLALLYTLDVKENAWKENPRIKELSLASIRFLQKSMHKDGSLDEFYPFERALGATSFALYAATEAYALLGETHQDIIDTLKKMGGWLCSHEEPSEIANHLLGAALALENLARITDEEKYRSAAKEKIKKALNWFSEEGWFKEYEGCDPGYHTFAVDFLAKYYARTKDKSLLPYLEKSVDFAQYFLHPDGSYAGEYGSRNTAHYFPHGFELLGTTRSLQMNDLFMEGCEQGKQEFMDDDVYFLLQVNNYVETIRDRKKERPAPLERKPHTTYFKEAKLFVYAHENIYGVVSGAKGVAHLFVDKKRVSDGGLIGKVNGQTVSTHYVANNEIIPKKETILIKGYFTKYQSTKISSSKLVLLRLLNMSVGRWQVGSDILKSVLVKMLITKKAPLPMQFTREIDFKKRIITDTVESTSPFSSLSRGSGIAAIQVPSSRYYQEAILSPFLPLPVEKLNKMGKAVFTRSF